jgi:hypothetical protein
LPEIELPSAIQNFIDEDEFKEKKTVLDLPADIIKYG